MMVSMQQVQLANRVESGMQTELADVVERIAGDVQRLFGRKGAPSA